MPTVYDCVVIGAGASGLACARRLLDAKLNVIILEGRARIGGRVHTVRSSSMKFPIELGAEFIHGAPSVVFDRLSAAGLSFYDLKDDHLQRVGGKFQETDFFENLGKLFQKLDRKRTPDRTVEDFLAHQRKLSPQLRKMATSYVEGFHAAELSLIGEKYLAESEQAGGDSESDLNGTESFRITEGYDRLMESFLHGIAVDENPVQLNTVVKKITWKKNRARLKLMSSAGFALPDLVAKKVVITAPLGVLKAPDGAPAAIAFEPEPKGYKAALENLHMGHCFRITFQFRDRKLWEDLRKEPIVFLHAGPEHAFPTWWTMMPMRTPLIVGWQGGPKAQALANLTQTERVQAALETLAYLLGQKLANVEKEVVAWFEHDWSNDPFSYGAYSYGGKDADRKASKLAKPFEDTLYFAGEATNIGAERGTVDGAIDTGLRTAEQILKTL